VYQALYRKWRPKTFDDVVGQEHITRTLKKQIVTGHLSHAYLFTGTRGTGKTTCAKLLAKAVNCQHPIEGNPCGVCPACVGIDSGSILDVVELDAASNNGVDQVRALRDEAIYSPAAVQKRVYIVDEVHMLSVAAFNALLKILEEPPEHLMFILATTELHKVPATILSRCQRFSFKRIQPADIQNRLLYIAQSEGIDLQEDGAALLARLADGALRDALSLLDQCAVSGNKVDKDTVLDALGLAGNTRTAHIMNAIRRGDTARALNELGDLYAAGKDVSAVLSELSGLTRDLLLRQTAGSGAAGLMAGGYDEATMQTLSKGLSPQRLLHMLTILQDAQAGLKNSVNRRTDAELCLIRLCDRRLDGSVLSLSERMTRIEAALAHGTLPAQPATGDTTRPFVPLPPAEGEQGAEDSAEPTPQELPPEPPIAGEQEEAYAPELTEQEFSPLEEEPPEFTPPPIEEPPELPPFPVEPEESSFSEPMPPVSQPAPVPPVPSRPTAFPAGKPAMVSAAGGGDARFWQELAPTLKGTIGPMAFAFISEGLVSGMYGDGTLTLYVSDDGSKLWFTNAHCSRTLEQAATAKAGRPVRVRVQIGAPNLEPVGNRTPAGEAAADPMSELLTFAMGAGKGIVTID
jgi:DNA polymerase-3 subunit gamma/tau